MGILSNEEEHSKSENRERDTPGEQASGVRRNSHSETRQRYTPREECGILNQECSSQKAISNTYIGQFWVSVYIWPTI